jgi:hypothetical protein
MKSISNDTKYYLTSSLNYRNQYFKEAAGAQLEKPDSNLSGFMSKYGKKKKDNLAASVSGGAGSGGGSGGEKVENIMFGDMSGEDIGNAATAYATGGLLSMFGPSIEKATKIAGLNLTRKIFPGSSTGGRLAGKVGADIASNVVSNLTGQIRKLSGFDFVNKNLANIADEQMHNIMQGYGKKTFLIPKSTEKRYERTERPRSYQP